MFAGRPEPAPTSGKASAPVGAPPRGEALQRALRSFAGDAIRSVPAPMKTTLHIAAACLFDEQGRLLLVRKRNTRFFMLPGGKREADEDALSALERELLEELEELRWLDTAQPLPDDLALLLRDQVLPALKRLPSV